MSAPNIDVCSAVFLKEKLPFPVNVADPETKTHIVYDIS